MKTTYENKIKIIEIKYDETAHNLNNERKKFQIISEERRLEEAEIMDEVN